jgi:hypothetical protein
VFNYFIILFCGVRLPCVPLCCARASTLACRVRYLSAIVYSMHTGRVRPFQFFILAQRCSMLDW